MNQITGKRIYNYGSLEVYEHVDGYIITNGVKIIMLKEMPCLNANVLRVLLSDDSSYYEVYQVTKFGNIVKESVRVAESKDPFDTWFERESELQELHAIGY